MGTRTVDNTKTGDEIITFVQKDMSDHFYGPGADSLKAKLRELKNGA